MSTNKIVKLSILNMGIVLLNIILFSPGLLNIDMSGENALSTSIGATAIFISFIVFIYGNYKLISRNSKKIKIGDLKNTEDYILALKQAYGKKTFDRDISNILEQIERFQRKKEKIKSILLQKFSLVDAGYEKFNETIIDVEYVFYSNIKSILSKVNAFDEEDYERISDNNNKIGLSAKVLDSKFSIYNEFITFVKDGVNDNEEIIVKLDALLLELSKFDSLEAGQIDNMNEMKEMDELIRKSKYYR